MADRIGFGMKNNGIIIAVEEWPSMLKKPILTVRFEGENSVTRAASFPNRKTAEWFIEVLKTFALGEAAEGGRK